MVEAIEDFADFQLQVLGRSSATVRGYRSDLLGLAHVVPDFAHFTLAAVREWLGDAALAGLSRATLARRTASVRAFSTWAQRQGYLDTDVAARLATPKVGRHLPAVLGKEEAAELVGNAVSVDERHFTRDSAILELLYATGMRVAELSALDVGDVDLERGTARVTGKGNKQRVVPSALRQARRCGSGWAFAPPSYLVMNLAARSRRSFWDHGVVASTSGRYAASSRKPIS